MKIFVKIDIELGNDAMRTWNEVQQAINELMIKSEHNLTECSPYGYKLHDINGNTIGSIQINEYE